MKLKELKLCLDCDTVFDAASKGDCPGCASAAFVWLSQFIPELVQPEDFIPRKELSLGANISLDIQHASCED
jgi:hypothetical protein